MFLVGERVAYIQRIIDCLFFIPLKLHYIPWKVSPLISLTTGLCLVVSFLLESYNNYATTEKKTSELVNLTKTP